MADPIDDLIRDRLRDSYPLDRGSAAVLDELRPQMVRARKRRKAVHASVGAAGVGALMIGALLLAPRLGTDDASELELAGPTESSINRESAEPASTTSELGRAIEEPGPTTAEETTSVAPTTSESSETSTARSSTAPAETTSTPTSTIASSTTSATGQTSTSSATSTTEGETTTSTSSSSTSTSAVQTSTVTTVCGTLDVELSGSGIRLLSTSPNSGVSVDVKDSGPETVEVRFRSDDRDCEVHAENRGGQLWTDIDNDIDEDDD